MDYLPINFHVQGLPCLVVGGGKVAYRKIRLLVKCGAVVTVVAPDILPEIKHEIAESGGVCIEEPYAEHHVNKKRIVIAATDQAAINKRVAKAALKRNCLINVVDDQPLSNMILPATIDRDPLIISVFSGGAPLFSKLIRAKLEAMLPANYGRLATLMGQYRERVKSSFAQAGSRRKFWEQVLDGNIAELVLSGQQHEAEQNLKQALLEESTLDTSNNPEALHNRVGEVYLVGAGPGDPDLLTFKALRLMQKADVVLYDRLVAKGLLELVRGDCERIFVGKSASKHTVPQDEINQMLVRLAKAGNRVCRLKGGDPFIFGRGGEEIGSLLAEKIPFQVVPGITAASGCASYAGIPLTHRDCSQSVRFVTGHLKDGAPELDWQNLIASRETLVIYMGFGALELICLRLQQYGMSPSMPIAVIEHGTTQKQRVITAELNSLVAEVSKANTAAPLGAPVLLIIGEVVKLRQTLKWFEPDVPSEN